MLELKMFIPTSNSVERGQQRCTYAGWKERIKKVVRLSNKLYLGRL